MLQVNNLKKNFGEIEILKGIDLTINQGEVLGFLGINGAGKTTTMRIIMGVLESSEGEVTYRGEKLGRKERELFGYMPEERGLYQNMQVREQVEYFGRLFGMNQARARERANEVLERLGVEQHAEKTVDKLSLGNQQRVQLSVALIHKPELLILDEPFSGLDPAATTAVAKVLKDLSDEGVGVLFSSHQLDLIEKLVDSVAILKDGIVELSGTAEEVKDTASNTKTRIKLIEAPADWRELLPPPVTLLNSNGREVIVDRGEISPHDLLSHLSQRSQVELFAPQEVSLREVFEKVVA